MVGDRVVFYLYKIDCQVPQLPETLPEEVMPEETEWGKFQDRLGRYRVETDGLYADNAEELADIKAGLSELGISYTATDISPTPKQVAKAKKIEGKTGSPREVLDYILYNIVPERAAKEQEIADLKRRVEKLEERI